MLWLVDVGWRSKRGAAGRAGLVREVLSRIYGKLFQIDEDRLSPLQSWLLFLARLVFVTVDAFFRERLQVRAAALSFFSFLSLVPSVALVFSIAKGLGAFDLLLAQTVRPFLEQHFQAEAGHTLTPGVSLFRNNIEEMIEIVGSTDVLGLGGVGLVVLILSIGRVMRGVEEAFDTIWGFSGRRPWSRRLPAYVLTTLLTPSLLAFATTLTAARQGQDAMLYLEQVLHVPHLSQIVAFFLPPLLVCAGILPLYLILPSARVRRRSAMVGALVGGLGWYLLLVVHVNFQLGVARQNVLYSGFGALPIFLLWLQLSWFWILLGGQVAAAHQNAPSLRQLARGRLRDHESRQAEALRVTLALADQPKGARLRALAHSLDVAVDPLRSILSALVRQGIVRRRGAPYDPQYQLALPSNQLRVMDVLDALGRHGQRMMPWEPPEGGVHEVLEGLQSAAESSNHNRTISELRRTIPLVESASAPARSSDPDAGPPLT